MAVPLAVKTLVDACPARLDFGGGSQRTQKAHRTVSGIISDDAENSRGPKVVGRWVVFEGSPVFVIVCFGSDSERPAAGAIWLAGGRGPGRAALRAYLVYGVINVKHA